MSSSATQPKTASYICHVFDASGANVTAGANMGDSLGSVEDLCLGDVYEFAEALQSFQLFVSDCMEPDCAPKHAMGQIAGRACIAEGSDLGRPGDIIALAARLTFMAPDGEKAELLLMKIEATDKSGEWYFLPLSPIEPGLDYTLIDIETDPAPVALSDITSVAFTRGTLITMADGRQRPVEELQPGELVLTRNAGAQSVRHVIQRTMRAVGAFAPVAISKDTLGNANDLIVSQHQRLFLYQRGPDRIVETAEMLVRAGDLVDDETVFLRKGGFVDYVSLVFDQHEVIYAECIPAESLLINDATRAHLPEDAQTALGNLSQSQVHATEAPSTALETAKERLLKGQRS